MRGSWREEHFRTLKGLRGERGYQRGGVGFFGKQIYRPTALAEHLSRCLPHRRDPQFGRRRFDALNDRGNSVTAGEHDPVELVDVVECFVQLARLRGPDAHRRPQQHFEA